MNQRILVFASAVGLACGLVGCQKPNMEEMMKPPPRPVELDRLAMFVGTWEGTGEMKMAGSDKVETGQGISTMSWDADKWVLTGREEYTMGKDGKYVGVATWTWDPKAKKYRTYGFDNRGSSDVGVVTYNEATRTWHCKHKTRSADGKTSVGEGTTKMVDDKTMEWQYTEWDGWKLTKFMEMKGTSRRK